MVTLNRRLCCELLAACNHKLFVLPYFSFIFRESAKLMCLLTYSYHSEQLWKRNVSIRCTYRLIFHAEWWSCCDIYIEFTVKCFPLVVRVMKHKLFLYVLVFLFIWIIFVFFMGWTILSVNISKQYLMLILCAVLHFSDLFSGEEEQWFRPIMNFLLWKGNKSLFQKNIPGSLFLSQI